MLLLLSLLLSKIKMKNTPEKLRKKIIGLVKEFHRSRTGKNSFKPGLDYINYAGRVYDEVELTSLVDSSLDFWLTSGRYAREFERKLAEYLNAKYCFLTNSGSSANLLAVAALTSPLLNERQLKAGDEIITTACGFPTTLNPIIQNNCVPVFVDVKIGNYNIDAGKIEKAITGKTKAIFVAHTLGNPVNIEKIISICKKHNLWYLEDNCDSLGSRYKGRFTGTFGHIATCSFYPAHHITMGEGGALLTNDPLLRRIILSFRDWGRDCFCEPGRDNTCNNRFNQQFGDLPFGYDHKYVYSHIGYNLKVTDMQASIGCAQLEKLDKFIIARKRNFRFLYDNLKRYKDYIFLPEPMTDSDPSWFGFPILVKDNASFSRSDIVSYLEENKIATRMLFGGNLIKQPAYRHIKHRISGNLKNTDIVMNNLFWVGVYPGLTNEKLLYMCEKIIEFIKENNN